MYGLPPSPKQQVQEFADDLAQLAQLLPEADPEHVARLIARLELDDTDFRRSVHLLGNHLSASSVDDLIHAIADLDTGGQPGQTARALDLPDLSSRLARLADQVRDCPSGIVWHALGQTEIYGPPFSLQVNVMLDLASALTAEEIAEKATIQQEIDEAISLADEPWDWPTIDEPEFMVTVTFEDDFKSQPQLVLSVGDREIYRRPSWHQGSSHLVKACRALSEAYPGRIKDFKFAPGTLDNLTWEDGRATIRIRTAFRPARKAYTRAQEKRKQSESCSHQTPQDSDT